MSYLKSSLRSKHVRSMCKALALILLLFFLASCGRTGSGGSEVPANNFRTGTQGLFMAVGPNTPPVRLYDYQDLDVLVELANLGAYSLPGDGIDRIYLSGFDNTIISGIPTDGIPIPALEGRNYFGPGTRDVIAFKGAIVPGEIESPYPVRMMLTACYTYQTLAEAPVCIDPDPFTTSRVAKVCVPQAVNLGSQGAPVAVQQIQIEPSTQRSRFAINIRNVGQGEPFKPGLQELSQCSPYSGTGLNFNSVDFVKVIDVTISGTSIIGTCKPLENGQFLRLTNGQATLFCDYQNIQGSGSFTAPMRVVLEYGYRDILFRDFTIVPEIR